MENRNDFIISAFTTLWGPRCPLSLFLLLRGKSEKKLKYIRKGDSGKPRKERERNERKERKRECPRLQASQECASNTRYNWRKAYTMGRRERSSQPSPIAGAASIFSQATKRRSLPVAVKRDGGGVGLPGTGSPRKILALDRCKQHEIAAYQRWISADGSRPKAAARLCASFLMKPTLSFAQKPCLRNDNAQKSKGCIRRWVFWSKTG